MSLDRIYNYTGYIVNNILLHTLKVAKRVDIILSAHHKRKKY